jgi:hypothetical protein
MTKRSIALSRNNRNPPVPNDSFTEFLLYTTPNGKVKLEIFLHNENIWLTQDKIAHLFGVQRPAVTKHLKNIFESGELEEGKVSSILEHTTPHGAIDGKTQVFSAMALLPDFIRAICTSAGITGEIDTREGILK